MVSGAITQFPSNPEVNADQRVSVCDLVFWAFVDMNLQMSYKKKTKQKKTVVCRFTNTHIFIKLRGHMVESVLGTNTALMATRRRLRDAPAVNMGICMQSS